MIRTSAQWMAYTAAGAMLGTILGATYGFVRAERQSRLSHVTN